MCIFLFYSGLNVFDFVDTVVNLVVQIRSDVVVNLENWFILKLGYEIGTARKLNASSMQC